MKVVLSKDVKDLGSAGQVKEVSDGYARNYLFPRKLAVPATPAALKQVEDREKSQARRQASEERLAQQIAERLKDKPLRMFPKVGEQGRLYGSITAADVAEALEKELGQPVDKRKIELQDPIRTLGEYKVPYRLSRTVTATLTVQVARSAARGQD
jgi:large subunit ribosomal protein L9